MAIKDINVMSVINQELAKMERRGGSRDYVDVVSETMRYAEERRKEAYYKDRELDGIGTSLDSLVSAIDNNASLATAEAQLALYEKEAGSNAEHKINAMALREGISRKREAFGNYGTAIQEASDAFDRGEMSFKQEDYENLPDTFVAINAKRKAEGLKEHGSIMDYMSSELTRTQRLVEGISPGIVRNPDGSAGAKFRYGKANNSDIATYNQLVKHAGNIEIAMKALAGDGLITPEEAEAIMVSPDNYEKVKTAAAGEAKSQLGAYQSKYNWWLDSMNKLEQNKFEFDESDALMMSIYEDLGGVDQQALKSGNIAKQKKVMAEQRDKYFGNMIFQDNKHFRWTGRHLIPRADDPDIDYNFYDDKGDKGDGDDGTPDDSDEPSLYEESKKIISQSSSPDVRKRGENTVSELEEVDKNIENQKNIKEKAEKERSDLEARKEQIETDITNIRTSFPEAVKPKDIQEIRKKLVLELKDIKNKLKSVGSAAYSTSFKKIIKDADKEIENLKEKKGDLNSILKSLERMK